MYNHDSKIELEKELNRGGISRDQRKLLNTLGFVSLEYVESLRSLAHLFGPKRSRCGIYLLWFADGSCYIGQAVDVVRRFSQHRADHSDIVAFGFQAVQPNLLDEVERRLIRESETGRLLLRNVEHVSQIVGERDLDDVISAAEQENWVKSPSSFNGADRCAPVYLSHAAERNAMRRLQTFESHGASADCVSLLADFALYCLPAPIRTEYTFWSVSCCPDTNANSWPRLACVNLSVMEVFVLGYHSDERDRIWGFMNISQEELSRHYSSESKLQERHPEIHVENGNYRCGGHDQVRLAADDLESMRELLSDQAVRDASAKLNLRLMRQRATICSRYQNPALARLIVSGQVKVLSSARPIQQ